MTLASGGRSAEELEVMAKVDERLHSKEITHTKGLFWCVVFGITRSGITSGTKLAEAMTHVSLYHVLLVRSFCLMFGAFVYGKYDGISFGY